MTRLAFVGTSFREVGFERLGHCVVPPEEAGERLTGLREALGASELVYLATCNRVELYLALEDARDRSDAELLRELPTQVVNFLAGPRASEGQGVELRSLLDEDAAEHLFSVTASLKSLAFGECEIVGQVRRAIQAARANGLAGAFLGRTFDQALAVGRRVRTETAIGSTPASVASLVLRRIREQFSGAPPRRAALVGVGDMTKKVALALRGGPTDIVIVNRTLSRADELAARIGIRALSLERFLADPPADLDLIVSATRAPEPIIRAPLLERVLASRGREPLLICDLGIPPDVDPALDVRDDVRVLRLEHLEPIARENQQKLAAEAERVRAIVAEEAARFGARLRIRRLVARGVESVLDGPLAHLAPEDRETLRRFADGLADRMWRQPALESRDRRRAALRLERSQVCR